MADMERQNRATTSCKKRYWNKSFCRLEHGGGKTW